MNNILFLRIKSYDTCGGKNVDEFGVGGGNKFGLVFEFVG
jgi:hypothetical protein